MKFRPAPLVYRAVCEGLVQGLKDAKGYGDAATPEQIVEVTAASIMQKLHDILIFDEEAENLLNLQRIAEGMAEQHAVTTTPA